MNHDAQQRRLLLKLAGLGLAAGALPACTQLATNGLVAGNAWPGYDDSLVIDGLSAAFDHGIDHLDAETLSLFRHSGIAAVNATIPYPGDDYPQTLAKIEQTLKVIERYPGYLRLVKTTDDILKAKEAGQVGIIMGFQSTEMIGEQLQRIDRFAEIGVRIMQLSYNGPSQFGDGGLVKANRGLTAAGRQAIEHMEHSKVLVDLSHSGQRTVAEAIRQARRPLTISHTGCNTVYRHPRNNDDAELKAVADGGGVVGIYLMPFLEGGDGELTAEALMRHLDHAINLCGEDHVAIGSDQGIIPVNDGPEYREMIRNEVKRRIAAGISAPGETPNRPPFIPELNSERRMALIADHLARRGYRSRVIDKIIGRNFYRLFGEVWS